MQNSTMKILLAGEGGQGVQTIAKALTSLGIAESFSVSYIPAFGVEQRGTPSVAYVIFSKSKIRYPKFTYADFALIMGERALKQIEERINPNTKIIFDSSNIDTGLFKRMWAHKFGLPATKYASEKFKPKTYNVMMYGALCKEMGLSPAKAWTAIYNILKDKFRTKEIEELNHDAFDFGFEIVFEKKDFSKPTYETKKTDNVFKNAEKVATTSPERCKGCGICIEKCPVKALSFGEDLGVFSTPVPEIDLEKCIVCGNCRRYCPDGAIKVEKK